MNELPPISPGTNSCRVPARLWQGSERGPESRQMWAVYKLAPADFVVDKHTVAGRSQIARLEDVTATDGNE